MKQVFGLSRLIAPRVIQWLFWIGLVLIVIAAALAIIEGRSLIADAQVLEQNDFDLFQATAAEQLARGRTYFYGGLLGGPAGLIIWRLLCEFMIIAFRIHDQLQAISRQLAADHEQRDRLAQTKWFEAQTPPKDRPLRRRA